MATLRDKVLYSLDTSSPWVKSDGSRSTVEIIRDFVQQELEVKGDRVYSKEVEENLRDSINVVRHRTLSEFLPLSARIANALLSRGLEKGEIVSLSMEDSTDYFMVVVGVWMAGGVIILSDPSRNPPIMLLEETKSRFIFCTSDMADGLLEAVRTAEHRIAAVVVVNSVYPSEEVIHLEEFVKEASAEIPDAHKEVKMEEGAVIFGTSGSTGKPKGVIWPHRSVVHAITNPTYCSGRQDSTYLSTASMHHEYGFLMHLVNALCRGNTFLFMCWDTSDDIPAEYLFAACHKYRPTCVATDPNFGKMMANAAMPPSHILLDSVERVEPVGSPMSEDVAVRLRNKFPNAGILNGYGMSEISGVCMSYTYNNLGFLVRGVTIRVVDAESGELLGADRVGEIQVKSETMMIGYLGVEKEVEEAAFTADGFVRTGDLGYYDASGQLFFKDRLKALIRYKDSDVFPNLIEAVILEVPGVADAGVLGCPDEEKEEIVTALVERVPGSEVTEVEILEYVNGKVGWYERVRGGVHFVEKIPRNKIGKVDRALLPGLLAKPAPEGHCQG